MVLILAFVIAFLSLARSAAQSFDWAVANTSVWLSAAAYCDTNDYLNRTYKGFSKGFIASFVVEYPEKDVQVMLLVHVLHRCRQNYSQQLNLLSI
jgi:hypothetical protein